MELRGTDIPKRARMVGLSSCVSVGVPGILCLGAWQPTRLLHPSTVFLVLDCHTPRREEGMPDAAWAYSRMEELLQEKQPLSTT